MHVLIIEDEFLVALAVQECVEEHFPRATIDLANTRREAVEAAQVQCPKVILADYRLGHGTGVSAVREICASVSPEIPVIYVTGSPEEVKALEPSATIVAKPFDCDSLASVIAEHVPSRQ